jgi:pimeloyl-ACP methyl ester carboxylesterase
MHVDQTPLARTFKNRWLTDHHCQLRTWQQADSLGYRSVSHMQPRACTPATPLVVFFHSTGSDPFYPQLQLYRAWLSAGLQVLAFDLDGHGQHSSTVFTGDGLADRTLTALLMALNEVPSETIHLAGYSLGAALAIACGKRLATQSHPRLSKVLAIAAPLEINLRPRVALRELFGFFGRQVLQHIPLYGLTGIVPAIGPLLRQRYPVRLPANGSHWDYVKTVSEAIAHIDLLTPPGLGHRIRFAYGGRDEIAPVSAGRRLAAALAANPGEAMHVYPAATHLSLVFSPDVIADTTAWLIAPTMFK